MQSSVLSCIRQVISSRVDVIRPFHGQHDFDNHNTIITMDTFHPDFKTENTVVSDRPKNQILEGPTRCITKDVMGYLRFWNL